MSENTLELQSKYMSESPAPFLPSQLYPNVNKYSVFPKVQPVFSKDQYKEQKQCFICKSKVNDLGLVEKKKYACMFCYNAVCQSCSPLRCYHPETIREERACVQCYFAAIEEEVKQQVRAETESASTRKSADDSDTLENERKECEEEIIQLDIHIQNANQEIERLERVMNKIQEERNARIKEAEDINAKEIGKLKIVLEGINREVERKKERVEKDGREVDEIRAENEKRESMIERMRTEIEDEEKKAASINFTGISSNSRDTEKQELITQLSLLKSQIAKLEAEQSNLKKQLADRNPKP
jgi:hypothetical protein